ncbi:DUF1330 domain-containing protein [Marinicellulosiphila megalodicopiae]|uniref:DUF1330 domain-containing protein n=1 Tax=Marinicellulosiphila megalodicopiae TaxID=2724896 RepID=UPI003BB15BC3
MTAYVHVSFTVKNPELMQAYSANAAQTIKAFKGEFLVKGPVVNLHGKSDYNFMAMIAFESKEMATQWYESSEYQKLIALRNEAMDSQFSLING